MYNEYNYPKNIVAFLEGSETGELFRADPLDIKLLDPEDFIKKNPSTKEITNHITFIRNGVPSPDGLLSNEIFGITKEERSGIYGYINLNGWFMQPFLYKIWSMMDKRIKNIAHSITRYSINSDGDFVEDPKGGTGMDWLRKNIDKVKIRSTESRRRDAKIQVLENNKDVMFIRKLIVIPPMYRDVSNTNGGRVEIGSINKYYQSIILTASSIKDRQEMFGVEAGEADKGRLQELLVSVYKALSGTSTNADDGIGLGRDGIMEEAGKAKTTDYGTRLVLTAPDLKVETLDDMMVDIQHSAVPLASALVNFKGYIIFYIRRFFDNEFGGLEKVQVCDSNGKLTYAEVKDYRTQFSDDVIEQHIESFIYGFSNRLEPVQVEIVNPNSSKPTYMKMVFKGKNVTPQQYAAGDIDGESSLINRPLTWCDILYMAAVEATRDKHVLITRYPIDSIYNQFPTKIVISTLDDTEPIYVNNTFYKWYPKIRKEDIGKDTSNMFKDTMNISNLCIGRMIADYDGDTVGDKGVYIKEANEELDAYINSKINYIGLSGNSSLSSSNEALQSLYSLTNILPGDKDKLSVPVF